MEYIKKDEMRSKVAEIELEPIRVESLITPKSSGNGFNFKDGLVTMIYAADVLHKAIDRCDVTDIGIDIGHGDSISIRSELFAWATPEKFMTCIGEDCAAYEDGECKRDVPAERTAEWMAFDDVDHKGRPTGRKILTCTNCNERESLDFGRRLPRYCSNCGRRMKGLFSVEKITMTINGETETL